MANLSDRLCLGRGFPGRGLMIAGGLDVGLVGLVLARVGNTSTGVTMLLLGVASAVYALLRCWPQANGG